MAPEKDKPIQDDSSTVDFTAKLKETLNKTEAELIALPELQATQIINWEKAKAAVQVFQPVPWLIWRLSNFILGQPGRPKKVAEGMLLGLNRIVIAAASDRTLGKGKPFSTAREALKSVRSDVVAASSVIHSISRRLHAKQHEKIWRPILDDAILRAHIGYFVGLMNLDFGPGRGMLAGFSGRAGLAILISSGNSFDAEHSLRALAQGDTLREVGQAVYNLDPLQVSALTLSACGCGKDAAFGTMSYAALDYSKEPALPNNIDQRQWLAAFAITDAIRTTKSENVSEELWKCLGFNEPNDKEDLKALVRRLVRSGHGWDWMI